MTKVHFTETQILPVLKEVEGGWHVKDVCRENGVSEASYYNWKSKLERLSAERGYPAFIRSDNGPEFIAAALAEWAWHNGVTLDFIQSGKPM